MTCISCGFRIGRLRVTGMIDRDDGVDWFHGKWSCDECGFRNVVSSGSFEHVFLAGIVAMTRYEVSV